MNQNQNYNEERNSDYVRISKKTLIAGIGVIGITGVSLVLGLKLKESNHKHNLIKAEEAIKTIIANSKEQGVIENKINGYVKCNQNIEHIKARKAEDRVCQDIVNIKLKELMNLIK